MKAWGALALGRAVDVVAAGVDRLGSCSARRSPSLSPVVLALPALMAGSGRRDRACGVRCARTVLALANLGSGFSTTSRAPSSATAASFVLTSAPSHSDSASLRASGQSNVSAASAWEARRTASVALAAWTRLRHDWNRPSHRIRHRAIGPCSTPNHRAAACAFSTVHDTSVPYLRAGLTRCGVLLRQPYQRGTGDTLGAVLHPVWDLLGSTARNRRARGSSQRSVARHSARWTDREEPQIATTPEGPPTGSRAAQLGGILSTSHTAPLAGSCSSNVPVSGFGPCASSEPWGGSQRGRPVIALRLRNRWKG